MSKIEPLTCEQFMEFDEDERKQFAQFAALVRNYSGSSSPAEEFILELIRYHTAGIAVTPDNLQEDIEEFRQNFDLAIATARLLARQYPAEVLGQDCGDRKGQAKALKAIAVEEDPNWESLAAHYIEVAREAIRRYPSLVLSGEPWEQTRKNVGFTEQ
jgi:hypothetical protein